MRFTFLAVAIAVAVGCSHNNAPTADNAAKGDSTTGANGGGKAGEKLKDLKIEDVTVGKGNEFSYSKKPVSTGDRVYVRYIGTLADGSTFDSNDADNKPAFTFVVGEGAVISGWDKGLPGMIVGGERKLSIPSDLGYGSEAKGPIPANSDLFFNVKLIDVVKAGEDTAIYKHDVKEGSGPSLSAGSKVAIKYSAKNVSGKVVEKVDKPLSFTFGAEEAFPALETGMAGMKVGGVRDLHIGPKFALPNKDVPSDTPEVLTIELVSVSGGK